MIDLSAVQNLIASWWFDYDQVNIDSWEAYFTEDAHFACRSDSGQSPVEEFLGADLRGRPELIAWHIPHRQSSPYPIRHSVTNVHLTSVSADEADFRSYLLVTTIASGAVVASASGLYMGTARAEDGVARFADMEIVLDFTDSRILAEIGASAVRCDGQ